MNDSDAGEGESNIPCRSQVYVMDLDNSREIAGEKIAWAFFMNSSGE